MGLQSAMYSATDASAGAEAFASTDRIVALERRVRELEQQVDKSPDPNRLNLVVFESHRDRLLAAFVMATGAAACGMNVTMFFTFWGTAALRETRRGLKGKSPVERMFGWLLPASARQTKLSKLHFCGLGRALMQREMAKKNIADLQDLINTAGELGVQIRICQMSMDLMGIRREELIEYPYMDYCGVASFMDEVATANTTLFI